MINPLGSPPRFGRVREIKFTLGKQRYFLLNNKEWKLAQALAADQLNQPNEPFQPFSAAVFDKRDWKERLHTFIATDTPDKPAENHLEQVRKILDKFTLDPKGGPGNTLVSMLAGWDLNDLAEKWLDKGEVDPPITFEVTGKDDDLTITRTKSPQ